jgi:hypothetical protein
MGFNGMLRSGSFILFFFLTTLSWSQGNLQFSQVKLVGTLETVPVGKVWKVESVMNNSTLQINTGTSSAQNNATLIQLNGVDVLISTTWGSSYATSAVQSTQLPIWLPQGTTVAAGTNVYRLSIIEFNIVP